MLYVNTFMRPLIPRKQNTHHRAGEMAKVPHGFIEYSILTGQLRHSAVCLADRFYGRSSDGADDWSQSVERSPVKSFLNQYFVSNY